MCEARVIINREGQEEVVMEEAARLKHVGKKLVVVSLVGESRELDAEIVEVDLVGHKVVLTPT